MARAPTAKRSAPRIVRRTATLPLHDGALRVAVVADTHSEPHRRSQALVAAEKPHAIIHAGDIGDLRVIDALSEIAPVLVVRGNIDEHATELPDDLTIEVTGGAALTILLTHIAVYGPKIRAEVAARAREDGAGLVICGHSHVPFIGRDKGLVVFNPGSIGPRRFQLPIVFGVMAIDPARQNGLVLKHVDCETGQQWRP